MYLGLRVHGYKAVRVWRQGVEDSGLRGGVKQGQQHGGELAAHLRAVEAGVCLAFGTVAPGELGEWARGVHTAVIGVEPGHSTR